MTTYRVTYHFWFLPFRDGVENRPDDEIFTEVIDVPGAGLDTTSGRRHPWEDDEDMLNQAILEATRDRVQMTDVPDELDDPQAHRDYYLTDDFDYRVLSPLEELAEAAKCWVCEDGSDQDFICEDCAHDQYCKGCDSYWEPDYEFHIREGESQLCQDCWLEIAAPLELLAEAAK